MVVVLVIALCACALGWVVYWLAASALALWVAKHGIVPSKGEIMECAKEMLRQRWGIK